MLLFGKYILIVIVAVLMLCVLSYISVPVYDFQSGRSFCGDSVYNPYAGADSSCWRKANFHAHQKEKPQCDYTVEQMLEAYRSNGYDIMSISDHQCLNTEHADRPGFISTYEHGYGINGYHQLVMGAERVTWRDFPLMLTQSQMQYMLHWLRPQAEALVLNHPGKTRIIDLAVYGWLRGYDLLEINPERGRERSEQYWDTALSAGIYSTLIGDDDAHNIRNRSSWFQRCFTMVNTPSLRPGDIMKSLKKGAAYAVYVPHDVNNRPDPHGDLPRMERISMAIRFASGSTGPLRRSGLSDKTERCLQREAGPRPFMLFGRTMPTRVPKRISTTERSCFSILSCGLPTVIVPSTYSFR